MHPIIEAACQNLHHGARREQLLPAGTRVLPAYAVTAGLAAYILLTATGFALLTLAGIVMAPTSF